ncbi:hypothetical protein [Spiroplasma eriocheiris]|uniref:Uncharacterized protein n=1 Tax=Spiroplasma eriocheiris TaxID=315358 RepID=A0A0H3XJN5_9MOLU|nr:hypothetical protein [Spiroplasma eriocheiris]AHF57617.1 hypothetical protein SPE_0489 [Spiroplasma eriocheiris CCTCC M 207170]AKM54071.1 hypothetical protein SERIO_v1c04960 [Spiroplasma eriocheiris]
MPSKKTFLITNTWNILNNNRQILTNEINHSQNNSLAREPLEALYNKELDLFNLIKANNDNVITSQPNFSKPLSEEQNKYYISKNALTKLIKELEQIQRYWETNQNLSRALINNCFEYLEILRKETNDFSNELYLIIEKFLTSLGHAKKNHNMVELFGEDSFEIEDILINLEFSHENDQSQNYQMLISELYKQVKKINNEIENNKIKASQEKKPEIITQMFEQKIQKILEIEMMYKKYHSWCEERLERIEKNGNILRKSKNNENIKNSPQIIEKIDDLLIINQIESCKYQVIQKRIANELIRIKKEKILEFSLEKKYDQLNEKIAKNNNDIDKLKIKQGKLKPKNNSFDLITSQWACGMDSPRVTDELIFSKLKNDLQENTTNSSSNLRFDSIKFNSKEAEQVNNVIKEHGIPLVTSPKIISFLKNLKNSWIANESPNIKVENNIGIIQDEINDNNYNLFFQNLQLYILFLDKYINNNSELSQKLNLEKLKNNLNDYQIYHHPLKSEEKNINYLISAKLTPNQLAQIKWQQELLAENNYTFNIWINFDEILFYKFNEVLNHHIKATTKEEIINKNIFQKDSYSELAQKYYDSLMEEFRSTLQTHDNLSLSENLTQFLVNKNILTSEAITQLKNDLFQENQELLKKMGITANLCNLNDNQQIMRLEIKKYLNRNILNGVPFSTFQILKYVILDQYPGFVHDLNTQLLTLVDVKKIIKTINDNPRYFKNIPLEQRQIFDNDLRVINFISLDDFSSNQIEKIKHLKLAQPALKINFDTHYLPKLMIYITEELKTFCAKNIHIVIDNYIKNILQEKRLYTNPHAKITDEDLVIENYDDLSYLNQKLKILISDINSYVGQNKINDIFSNWQEKIVKDDPDLNNFLEKVIKIINKDLYDNFINYKKSPHSIINSNINNEISSFILEFPLLIGILSNKHSKIMGALKAIQKYVQDTVIKWKNSQYNINEIIKELVEANAILDTEVSTKLLEYNNFVDNLKRLGVNVSEIDSNKINKFIEWELPKFIENSDNALPLYEAELQTNSSEVLYKVSNPEEIYKFNQTSDKFLTVFTTIIKELFNFILSLFNAQTTNSFWKNIISDPKLFINSFEDLYSNKILHGEISPFEFYYLSSNDSNDNDHFALLFAKNNHKLIKEIIQEMLNNPSQTENHLIKAVINKMFHQQFAILFDRQANAEILKPLVTFSSKIIKTDSNIMIDVQQPLEWFNALEQEELIAKITLYNKNKFEKKLKLIQGELNKFINDQNLNLNYYLTNNFIFEEAEYDKIIQQYEIGKKELTAKIFNLIEWGKEKLIADTVIFSTWYKNYVTNSMAKMDEIIAQLNSKKGFLTQFKLINNYLATDKSLNLKINDEINEIFNYVELFPQDKLFNIDLLKENLTKIENNYNDWNNNMNNLKHIFNEKDFYQYLSSSTNTEQLFQSIQKRIAEFSKIESEVKENILAINQKIKKIEEWKENEKQVHQLLNFLKQKEKFLNLTEDNLDEIEIEDLEQAINIYNKLINFLTVDSYLTETEQEFIKKWKDKLPELMRYKEMLYKLTDVFKTYDKLGYFFDTMKRTLNSWDEKDPNFKITYQEMHLKIHRCMNNFEELIYQFSEKTIQNLINKNYKNLVIFNDKFKEFLNKMNDKISKESNFAKYYNEQLYILSEETNEIWVNNLKENNNLIEHTFIKNDPLDQKIFEKYPKLSVIKIWKAKKCIMKDQELCAEVRNELNFLLIFMTPLPNDTKLSKHVWIIHLMKNEINIFKYKTKIKNCLKKFL